MSNMISGLTGRNEIDINQRLDRLPNWTLSPLAKMVFVGAYFFAFFDIVSIGAALPSISSNLHLTSSDIALPLSAGLVGYILGSLILGTIADRIGRRRVLFFTLLLLAVSSLLCAFAQNIEMLSIFRLLVGAGIGAQITLSATYISELSPPAKRGRNIQLNVIVAGIGDAFAPIAAILLLRMGGDASWRVLLGMGVLAVIPAALMFWLPESPRWLAANGKHEEASLIVGKMEKYWTDKGSNLAQVQTPDLISPVTATLRQGHQRGRFTDLLKRPIRGRLLITTAYWGLLYAVTYGFLGFEPTLLDKLSIAKPHGLFYTALGDLALPIGAALPMLLVNYVPRRFILGASALIYAAGLLILSASTSGGTAVTGAFLVALVILINSGVGYTYTSEIFPTKIRASAVGFADGVGHLGGVIAPYIILGSMALWTARGAFVVMALMMVACALLISTLGVHRSEEALH